MPFFGCFSTTRRKFGVDWTFGERTEFESFARSVVRGGVQVRLAENDHPDVSVQIYFSRFGTSKPKKESIVVLNLSHFNKANKIDNRLGFNKNKFNSINTNHTKICIKCKL